MATPVSRSDMTSTCHLMPFLYQGVAIILQTHQEEARGWGHVHILIPTYCPFKLTFNLAVMIVVCEHWHLLYVQNINFIHKNSHTFDILSHAWYFSTRERRTTSEHWNEKSFILLHTNILDVQHSSVSACSVSFILIGEITSTWLQLPLPSTQHILVHQDVFRPEWHHISYAPEHECNIYDC